MSGWGRRIRVWDLVQVLLTLLFLVGMKTVFRGCDAKEDGSFMVCHWAEVSLLGIGAVLFISSLLHLGAGKAYVKLGLDLGMVPLIFLALLIPNQLIPLCLMSQMRCHLYMRPFSLIFCILMLVVSGGDMVRCLLEERKEGGTPKGEGKGRRR